MANVHIVERLNILADQLEKGEITLRQFAEQVPGHTTALEKLSYSQIKEAQLATVELSRAADLYDQGTAVNSIEAVEWLRSWLTNIPLE